MSTVGTASESPIAIAVSGGARQLELSRDWKRSCRRFDNSGTINVGAFATVTAVAGSATAAAAGSRFLPAG